MSTHVRSSIFITSYRCKKEFDKRQDLLERNVDRLCGLAMYFGELFLVLEVSATVA